MNVQHSSKSVEAYTPPEIVEAARATMGGIDLDPASCVLANSVIKAREWMGPSIGINGLQSDWRSNGPTHAPTRVLLNPPGGQLNRDTLEPAAHGASSAAVWWGKLTEEWEAGNVEQAIFVCFSMAVFKTAQSLGYPAPYRFPFCVPRQRLRFWGDDRPPGTGQPSHDNAIVYLPPCLIVGDEVAYFEGRERFRKAFSPFGEVRL